MLGFAALRRLVAPEWLCALLLPPLLLLLLSHLSPSTKSPLTPARPYRGARPADGTPTATGHGGSQCGQKRSGSPGVIHSSMISHSLRTLDFTDVLLARGGSAVYVRGGAGCANFAEPTLTPREWLNVEHPYRNDARRHRHGRRTTYQHGVAAALVGCAQSRSSAGRWAAGGAARRPTRCGSG